MKPLVLAAALLTLATTAQADIARGKSLHNSNCMKCHGTEVYTRDKRMVNNRAALAKQVRRCQLNLGLQWFNEDLDSVVDYLDQTFYRFGK